MNDSCVRHLLRQHREIEKSLVSIESRLDNQTQSSCSAKAEGNNCASLVEDLSRCLAYHIRKEDEILLPELEAFLPRDCGPVAVLRAEYSALRMHLTSMRRAVGLISESETHPQLQQAFQSSVREIIRIIRDQIYKEDRVLFPLIARAISSGQDARLVQQMEAVGHWDAETLRHRSSKSPQAEIPLVLAI